MIDLPISRQTFNFDCGAKALQVGRQIMKDFPRSRMAQEVREKLDALEQRAQEQGT